MNQEKNLSNSPAEPTNADTKQEATTVEPPLLNVVEVTVMEPALFVSPNMNSPLLDKNNAQDLQSKTFENFVAKSLIVTQEDKPLEQESTPSAEAENSENNVELLSYAPAKQDDSSKNSRTEQLVREEMLTAILFEPF